MPPPKHLFEIGLSLSNRSVIPTEAKWRDLLFILRIIESDWKRCPPLCHPDRSEAKWRDLQFRGPFLEMCFDTSCRCRTQLRKLLGLSSLLFGELFRASNLRFGSRFLLARVVTRE
jgi:hypothetical protein